MNSPLTWGQFRLDISPEPNGADGVRNGLIDLRLRRVTRARGGEERLWVEDLPAALLAAKHVAVDLTVDDQVVARNGESPEQIQDGQGLFSQDVIEFIGELFDFLAVVGVSRVHDRVDDRGGAVEGHG